jgi:hypothetical protein
MSTIPRHVALLIEIAAIAASHKEASGEPGIATLLDRLSAELTIAYTGEEPA